MTAASAPHAGARSRSRVPRRPRLPAPRLSVPLQGSRGFTATCSPQFPSPSPSIQALGADRRRSARPPRAKFPPQVPVTASPRRSWPGRGCRPPGRPAGPGRGREQGLGAARAASRSRGQTSAPGPGSAPALGPSATPPPRPGPRRAPSAPGAPRRSRRGRDGAGGGTEGGDCARGGESGRAAESAAPASPCCRVPAGLAPRWAALRPGPHARGRLAARRPPRRSPALAAPEPSARPPPSPGRAPRHVCPPPAPRSGAPVALHPSRHGPGSTRARRSAHAPRPRGRAPFSLLGATCRSLSCAVPAGSSCPCGPGAASGWQRQLLRDGTCPVRRLSLLVPVVWPPARLADAGHSHPGSRVPRVQHPSVHGQPVGSDGSLRNWKEFRFCCGSGWTASSRATAGLAS